MNWKWLRTGLAIASVGALSIGCAEERAPINRVQANALAKSFFVGADLKGTQDDPEFWTQGTLVDVGYGASQDGLFTSTYAQNVARVKWQVTENLLIARLTYERISTSDGKGAGPASSDGQVVAAYRIHSHFDIRNAYNPSTGEELNVIEENGSDRPWYDREYFRVDWSENLNTDAYDFDTLSLLGLYGGVEYTSLSYYVNDPDDEDAPHFDVDNGYFDVTTKAFATPKMIDLSHLGWGIEKFPACMLPDELFGGSEPVGNCNAVELTVRQAYRKVVDNDYQPEDWDGYRFQAFGAFTTDRHGYARNYGMTDQNLHRFISRYNIWERSHYYKNPAEMKNPVACYTPDTLAPGEDPHGDGNNDGTEDRCWLVTVDLAIENGDCAPTNDVAKLTECYNATNWKYGGSKCDTFRQACTLPYRFRNTKPLAWYYTTGSNKTYFDGTEWATHDHDVAMRHAVMTARYSECMATSGNNKQLCLTGVDPATNKPVAAAYPVYFGQMDDHLEAKLLAQEVDDCRHGLSHADFGAINSKDREDKCVALASEDGASSVLVARRNAGATIDAGVGALARMPEQIVLCHSPVEANDPAVCAPADRRLPAGMTAAECTAAVQNHDSATLEICHAALNARRGDLRYHQVNVLTAPQTPSPWGIMVDSRDPLTGEGFAASVNVWTHVNDLWSQGVIDRVRYIKGELTTAQVTDGTFIKDWAQAAEAASGGSGIASRVTRKQLDERLAGMTNMTAEEMQKLRQVKDAALDKQIHAMTNQLTGVAASIDGVNTHAATYQARRNAALGTPVEAELMTAQMQRIAGVEGMPLAGTVLDAASPLRGMNPNRPRQMENMLQNALAERGICVMNEAPAPMSLTGLADVLERKFENACAATDEKGGCKYTWGKFGTVPQVDGLNPESFKAARAEVMRMYLSQRAQYAVIVHEMGHSVGERHNFVSSSDAFNFRPQYWQLRTANGKNKTECTDYTADGSTCVGPRWFDPTDKNERDNLIWMWMQSSVMDYAGEYTQDLIGLGAYDFGAHRLFYGDSVAVYSDASYDLGKARSKWVIQKMDNFGGLLGFRPSYDGTDIHYSQYQKNYDLITDCKDVTDTGAWKPASWNEAVDGVWDPLLDGMIVTVGGKATKCAQQKVDYVQWKGLRFPTKQELVSATDSATPYYRGGPAVQDYSKSQKRVRVPYGFATDRWADLGNAAVYRHDNGADNYEVFDFLISQQEVNHIFDDYRRNRATFSVRAASSRILGRYNEKVRDGAKGLTLMFNIYKDFAKDTGYNFNSLWGYLAGQSFADQLLASSEVFDHFTRMFARPQAGWHGVQNGVLVSEDDAYAQVARQVTIPDGASLGKFGTVAYNGKLLENRLAENKGEYDSEYTMNAGSYYDKVTVPYLIAESADNFISSSRQDFLDSRYRAVSLADLFSDGYRRFVANMVTGDSAVKGWGVAADATGKILVDQDKDGNKWPKQLGHVQWWTPNTQVCFPAEGTSLCTAPGNESTFGSEAPEKVIPLDSEVGWEQQKFLIAYTMIYIPENQRQNWIDMMKIWQAGADADPGIANRIEFHDPAGRVWTAQTFGKETLTHVTPAKTVQKGIAARSLEWANSLLVKAYETTDGPDLDGDSQPDWYMPVYANGAPIVKFDPTRKSANGPLPSNCSANDNSGCTCEDNASCEELVRYVSVIDYMRKAGLLFWQFPLGEKGIYN